MKFITIIFLLFHVTTNAQLGSIGVEEGAGLIPEVEESEKERVLKAAKKNTMHPELALLTVTHQIRSTLLKKHLDENNENVFKTNSNDLKEMAQEFSLYSQAIDSLSKLFLEKSIQDGASEVTPNQESNEVDDCQITAGAPEASCDKQVFIAENPIASTLPDLPQVQNMQTGLQSVISEGRPPSIRVREDTLEERNLVIISMTNSLREGRQNLEGLISKGLINEIKLEGIAVVKKSFEKYQENIGMFFNKTNEVNSDPKGKCEIPQGSLEIHCFGTRYALRDQSSPGEQSSAIAAINDDKPTQVDFSFTESDQGNSLVNSSSFSN